MSKNLNSCQKKCVILQNKNKIMTGINFVTNDNGEKVAIQINLKALKHASQKFLEELEDYISIELSKNQESIDFESNMQKLIARKKKNK